ncbi:YcjF family protein [Endozoicomonas sp. GU-1]|uniref:YcjF family protein n=1 Tax=Endozoicomonas sp. GU-1 TaxID=3009078 RepID=UPI0022B35092|nr:YcjF family protein [Endozoicomonas sp. GU-1]WBA81607.1 YcjF family protein [Endozoicomonas sp. GU-1]WBA84560.1 YcjF family protein [Endozoicomonas sp. GU-1]
MTRHHDPYFIPLEPEQLLETPESISDGFRDPVLQGPELAAKPLRFIRSACYGLLTLLLILVLWQTVELGLFLYQLHWSLALVFALLFLALTVTVVKAVVEFFLYQRDFRQITELQAQAAQFRDQRTTVLASQWTGQLSKLYQGKTQQMLLEQVWSEMPDYSDDSELLVYLDSHFFQTLDQRALACISQHSQQVALMVALSPFAAVDMLLSVWRSIRMLDEICQVYGVRPSLPARSHLLTMVLEQMALAGATELLSDQLSDFTSNRLLGVVSSQAASGVGVGIYSARMGLRAMALCRPIPYADGQKPGIGHLARSILAAMDARFRTMADPGKKAD